MVEEGSRREGGHLKAMLIQRGAARLWYGLRPYIKACRSRGLDDAAAVSWTQARRRCRNDQRDGFDEETHLYSLRSRL